MGNPPFSSRNKCLMDPHAVSLVSPTGSPWAPMAVSQPVSTAGTLVPALRLARLALCNQAFEIIGIRGLLPAVDGHQRPRAQAP